MSDYDEIRKALSHLDAGERDFWVRMGAAVKDELGEDGFELWDDWSRQSDSYKSADAKAVWKSLKQGHIHIGTLFYHARENGYRPDKPYTPPSPEEVARRAAEAAAKKQAAEQEQQRVQAKAARTAYGIWKNSQPATPEHAYLQAKGIDDPSVLRGVRVNEYKGSLNLVVPIYADKKLVNVQTINADGGKHFLDGGRVQGGYSIVGDMKQADKGLYVAEGFATAASVHQATGQPVIVAFNAGNLVAVAEKLAHNLHENQRVIFAADNDASQTGLKKAQQAAALFNGRAEVMMPEFSGSLIAQYQATHGQDKLPSDFNDLHQLAGLQAVRDTLGKRVEPEQALPEPDFRQPEMPSTPQSDEPFRPTFNAQDRQNWANKIADLPEEAREIALDEMEMRGLNVRRDVQQILEQREIPPEQVDFRQPENPESATYLSDEPDYAPDDYDFEQLPTERPSVEQIEMWKQSERSDWGDFPPLVRNGSLEEMKNTDGYQEAKAGDPRAALNLVQSLLSEQTIDDIKKMANGREPIIVGIRAEESKGKNQIPNAMAHVLADKTGWERDTSLYQISYAGRTGSDSSYRLAFPAVFGGDVKAGRDYLLLDDNSTMGGTIAGLKGYIENRGGRVIGAAVMSARATGLELVPTVKQLNDIQQKHGDVANDYFQKTFGYGITRLTRGEAGAVRTAPTFDTIRNRIDEARLSASGQNHGRVTETTPQQIESAQRHATERNAESKVNPPKTAVPETAVLSSEPQQKDNLMNAQNNQELNGIEYDTERAQKRADIPEPPQRRQPENPEIPEPDFRQPKSDERKAITDLEYERPPALLRGRYIVADGQYLSPENHRTVIFEDKGNKLTTSKSDQQTVDDMLAVAQAKGWQNIKLSGSQEFKSMMYIAAESRGISTSGYKPTEQDLAMVAHLREQRSRNGIEHADFRQPERSETPEQEKPKVTQTSETVRTAPDTAALSAAEKLKEKSVGDDGSIPPEVSRTTDQMKAEASQATVEKRTERQTKQSDNPDLTAAKAVYVEKSEKLNQTDKARLKFYENNTLDFIRHLDDKHQDKAMLAYYKETSKMMKGSKLNLPEPTQTPQPSQSNLSPKTTPETTPQRSKDEDLEIER